MLSLIQERKWYGERSWLSYISIIVTLKNRHIVIIPYYQKCHYRIFVYQLHFVSRTQQGRQKEPVVLRHSFPHFPPDFGGIACWVAALNAALSLVTRAKKWILKYFISSSGDRTHDRRVTVTLLCLWATTASISIFSYFYIFVLHKNRQSRCFKLIMAPIN